MSATPTWAELARHYRRLAATAKTEGERADENDLGPTVWRTLHEMWTSAAEDAVRRRFNEECTCPDHRAARQAAGR